MSGYQGGYGNPGFGGNNNQANRDFNNGLNEENVGDRDVNQGNLERN
jgi:hypothetical protein